MFAQLFRNHLLSKQTKSCLITNIYIHNLIYSSSLTHVDYLFTIYKQLLTFSNLFIKNTFLFFSMVKTRCTAEESFWERRRKCYSRLPLGKIPRDDNMWETRE